jgi:predicted enzyme related to lactoylglutathione lyase
MPTRDTAWPNGTPCWIDYGAADIDAAKAFYTDVLGWSYEGGDDPQYGGYLTAQTQGRAAAGMAPQQDPNDPPKWMTYFASDDVDGTAKRLTEAGGTLLFEPMDVGPMGRMVIARDPQGHPFGVWQAGEHTGARIYNEPGSLVWNEAAVDDPKAAQEFYSAAFGFTFDEIPDMGGYATFKTDGGSLGGISATQPGHPTGWTSCFSVANTDKAVEAVQKAGGKVTMAAQDTPFGRFAVLEDPWGAAFSVMQELPS